MPAAPLPPAPIHPMRSQDSGVRESKKPTSALRRVSSDRKLEFELRLHWGWVTNSLSELTSYLILRRKIDLLEQLGRDGQAARCLDLPQGIICVVAAIKVVAYSQSQSASSTHKQSSEVEHPRVSLRVLPRRGACTHPEHGLLRWTS